MVILGFFADPDMSRGKHEETSLFIAHAQRVKNVVHCVGQVRFEKLGFSLIPKGLCFVECEHWKEN